jgi:hypothetical protein
MPDAAEKKRHRPSQERKIKTIPLPRDWEGDTVVLIASGPSLTKGQVAEAKFSWIDGDVRVMGCNNAYQIAPWLDALYCCDPEYWDFHIDAIRKTHIDDLISQDRLSCEKYGLWWTPKTKDGNLDRGFSGDPTKINTGGSSGFQQLNVAALRGAKKIILIGYDCTDAGRRHWHPDHEGKMDKRASYAEWLAHYRKAAPTIERMGIEVINCSPGSAIDCFRRDTIGNVLG